MDRNTLLVVAVVFGVIAVGGLAWAVNQLLRSHRREKALANAPEHVQRRVDKIVQQVGAWEKVSDVVKTFFINQVKNGPYTDKLLALGPDDPYPKHDFAPFKYLDFVCGFFVSAEGTASWATDQSIYESAVE